MKSDHTVEAPRQFLAGNPAADVSDFFWGGGGRFWGTTSDVTLGNKSWLSCLSQPAAFKVHILKEKKSGSDICCREYRDAFKLRLILKSISTKSNWKKDVCVYM